MILENEDLIQYNLGKKKQYGFIVRDKVITGSGDFIEVNNAINPEELTLIKNEDIIINYGKEPDLKSLKLDVFFKTFLIPLFGSVTDFRGLSDLEEKIIKDTLTEMVPDCENVFNVFPTRIFIKASKGKVAGSFKRNRKEDINEITLMPEAFDKDNIKYITFHEIAHALWSNCVPVKLQAAWIRLYDRNMERKKIKANEVSQLRSDLLESGLKISDYAKVLEDSETIKKVMKHIKELYNLKPSHLDVLITQGDDLTKYWPSEDVELSEYNVFVSEYAKQSVEEFFAESFAFYQTKMQLPDSVYKAIEKTIEVIG